MHTIDGNCIFENLNFAFEGSEMLRSNVFLGVWHKSNSSIRRDKLVGRNVNVLMNTSFNDISDREQIVDIIIMNRKGSKIVGNLSLHVVLKRPVSSDNDNDNTAAVAAAAVATIRNPTTAAAACVDDNHDSFSIVSDDMSHFTNRTTTTTTAISDAKKKRSILSVFNVFKSKNAQDSKHQDSHHHQQHHNQASPQEDTHPQIGDVTMLSSTERENDDGDEHSETSATVSNTSNKKKKKRFFTMKRLWRTKNDS